MRRVQPSLVMVLALAWFLVVVEPVYCQPFSLTVYPPYQVVPEGGVAVYQVVVQSTDAAAHKVRLSVDGYTGFSPNPVNVPAGGSATSELAFTAAYLAPGTYALAIVGYEEATDFSTSAVVTLTVTPVGPPLDVEVSTDKSSYIVGETVVVTMKVNKWADFKLKITAPDGSAWVQKTGSFPSSGAYTVSKAATEPIGTYTATLEAAHWSEYDSDSATFTVNPATYAVSILISGLPSDLTATLKVDGVSEGEVKGGEIRKLTFPVETTHSFEVDQYVAGSAEGVRYFCSENTWTASGESSHTFQYEAEYYLQVTTDPPGITTVMGENWYRAGTPAATNSVPEVVSGPTGVRYVFKNWEVDGVAVQGSSASVAMDSAHKAIARFTVEYELVVISEYGDPKGSEWYPQGSVAQFSVTSPVGFLTQHVFVQWSGDSTETTPVASTTMDRPKRVEAVWKEDRTQLYTLLAAVVAVIIVLAILVRRVVARKPSLPPSQPPTPPSTPPPSYKAVPQPPVERKFCVNCGGEIPLDAESCPSCGTSQTEPSEVKPEESK